MAHPAHHRAPVRFGANYTPSQHWFHSWTDLDLDSVRRDMESIAGLGLDHVRIFPLWEVLQPNRTLIRPRALTDVVAVADAAAEAGLELSVDVLQGHLSSYDFLPSWMLSWHRRGFFTDDDVREAQVALITALGQALAGHEAFTGFTLGNETNQFAKPEHPDRQDLDQATAGQWLTTLLGAAARSAPAGRHTHSFDDAVWFDDRSAITPEHAVQHGDLTTVHSWVFTGVAQHFPTGHSAYPLFARYLLEMATAWGGQRGVWLQEVGAPQPHLGAGGVVPFAEQTLHHVITHPELTAVTWWCSHDVDRTLADFPELEYSLGLLGSDRSVKPLGRAVRDLLPQLRRAGRPAPATEAMVMPLDAQGRVVRSRTAPGSDFFATWVQAAGAGEPPRIQVPPGARSLVQE